MTTEQIADVLRAQRSGNEWKARCPAHDDQQPSLSISQGRDGRTLLNCHAGCSVDDVLGRAGLRMADLYASGNGSSRGPIIATYDYRDTDGNLRYQSLRYDPKEFRQRMPDGRGGWIPSIKGVPRLPYRLPELRPHARVFIAEGEKDVDRLWSVGLPATCNSGGAGKWTNELTAQLRDIGVRSVTCLPDNDEPGRAHMVAVAQSCCAAGMEVQILGLPDLPPKGDVSDYLDRHSCDELLALVAIAPQWDEPATVSPAPEVTETRAVVVPYAFVPAFGAEHFVHDWIDTFSKQCDAAHEYHEAVALVALAQATPTLTARISGSADGLRTNLFVLLLGEPGRSRKSTAMSYGVSVLKRTLPHVLLPEQMTQESFVESLTACNGHAALWAVDEFTDMIVKIVNSTYLTGIRGLLLEMYARNDYTYRRVSKRLKKKTKDGDDVEHEEDAFHVSDVTLSVLGCATPTIFQSLDNTAVGSGLFTRFAIVAPESKPPRLPQFALEGDALPNRLVTRLKAIADRTATMPVVFADGVLERLDAEIDRPLDESSDRCLMTVRAGVMARKVAMLSGAGRLPEFALSGQALLVTMADAESAIRVVSRWIDYARAFESRTDATTFELSVERCAEVAKNRTVNRREVARRVHVPAKVMLEIQNTLEQRGLIEVHETKQATGRPSVLWRWVGGE